MPFDVPTFFERVEADDARGIELFMKAGMSPAVRDGRGRTALRVAVEAGGPAAVRALVAAGAGVDEAGTDTQDPFDGGDTLVMRAVARGQAEIVAALVDGGAQVNRGNDWGVTPLMQAARKGEAALVALLLRAGADPNAEDTAGTPVLHGPVIEGHVEVVESLLASGARVGRHRARLLDVAVRSEVRRIIETAP